MKKHFLSGEIALFTAAAIYGLFGIFSRLINFQLPFFFQQWIRNLFAVVIFIILILIFGGWKKIEHGDLKWFFARSICGFISFIGIYYGFIYLDISTNYFVSYATATIGGYLIGKFFFKEQFNKLTIISLFLSILGLIFIFSITLSFSNLPYIALSAVAGIAAAAWNTFSKKISGTYSNFQLNLFDFSFATVLPLLISIFLRENWILPSFNSLWITTLLFALMFMATGVLVVYGFSKVSAQKGSLIMLFDIIVGISLGYFIFGEALTLQKIIGGILIVVGIILPNVRNQTK